MIRKVRDSDAPSICEIYNYYIKNTIITFEEEKIEEIEIYKRIKEVIKNYPWIVYEEDGRIVGYAYATKWKERFAYRYSVESTVYLNKNYFGKGIGGKLLKQLVEEAKSKNIHSLIGGIALPNKSSIALFEKLNFKKVAHFKEVGFKFGKWIDVGYWERII
jgi:L-amino acid N-acyltransferase YncA